MLPGQLPQDVMNTLNGPLPSQAAMDALNGGAPGPVLPTQTGPTQSNAGQNALGGGATAEGSKPQVAAGTFAEKLAQAADKLGIPTKPDGTPVPGGWARTLVGAAQHALSGVASGVQAVGASLGDAAAAGENLKPGQGGLAGAFKTLQARNQRLSEQDKNKAMMAESNARMIHEQALVHKLDEDDINTSITAGTQMVEKNKTAASPAPVIAEGLTSDELKQYLKDNKIDPTKETAYPTGRKAVGEDKNGKPILRTTYTAMGVAPDIDLDPEKAEDKAILDRLNKFAPPPEGKWGSGGVQHFSGNQLNFVSQRAADNQAATMARDKTLRDNDIAEQEGKNKLEALTFAGSSEWTNALANNNNDPLKALDAITGNPQLRAKYPNLAQDVRAAYGDKAMDKLEEERIKRTAASEDDLSQLQKDLDKAHGEDAASIAAGLQAKLKDPKTPTSHLARINQMLIQANAQAKASLNYDINKKTQEAAAEEAANTGDLRPLTDMVLKYQYDPNDLFSRLKGKKQLDDFLANIHTVDPNWSMADYKARFKTVQDFTPEGKGGLAVQSLNTFAGHTGDANSLITSLQNTRSPLLNEGLNIVKKQLGNDKIQPYIGALAAASHEYINFLNNQHAKTASDEALAAKLTDENTPPNVAQAVLRQMAQTIAFRTRSLNAGYKHTMKEDYPDMFTPESAQVMRNFGIDLTGLGGVTGEQPGQSSPLPKAALSQLKEGQHTTFGNGQTWTLQNGKPVQVQPSK